MQACVTKTHLRSRLSSWQPPAYLQHPHPCQHSDLLLPSAACSLPQGCPHAAGHAHGEIATLALPKGGRRPMSHWFRARLPE